MYSAARIGTKQAPLAGVPPNAPTIYVGKPPGKNTGPTRSTQQQGTEAAAAARGQRQLFLRQRAGGGQRSDDQGMDQCLVEDMQNILLHLFKSCGP